MSWDALQALVLPDPWQQNAIEAILHGHDAIVTAPTGAGKTYIFEKLVPRFGPRHRAIYTVPTRALANDKFAEWRARGWRVGLLTGDFAIHPDAPILTATLEAVLPSLTSTPPELLVIDEFQWLADPARGNHYESAIAFAPLTTRLLLLSGCVANPDTIAAWLSRLGRQPRVIQHRHRPVPLEEIDADRLSRAAPPTIQSFWPKRIAGALRQGLGPILIFAPHRAEAERLARQLARELPNPHPLTLSHAQTDLAGPDLTRLLRTRIAFHHSGLTYPQRAGLIEPLAKAGQLRAVVATLGLAAGINFSLRSVLVTASSYQRDGLDHPIPPHDLLQMAGRAGRRGLDDVGYFLFSRDTPRLTQAHPLHLRRSPPLPWPPLLRTLIHSPHHPAQLVHAFSLKLFAASPPALGLPPEETRLPHHFPCGQVLPTSRARLIRRTRKRFKGCLTCTWRSECLSLSPEPSLLWQWKQLGLFDRNLAVTPRGTIVAHFSGPEGLAIAAALEQPDYPLDHLLFDLADLFAGNRFCTDLPRWSGRLAEACRTAYGRFTLPGWLEWGVPPAYGAGGADTLISALNRTQRRTRLTGDHAGPGDIDRLLIEWWSLLRQIAAAPNHGPERWIQLRHQALTRLNQKEHPTPPNLPPLTAEQTLPFNCRL
ncbi:MAG: DEAD/DEAH box helicase [Verrucomicrobiia bacterium]